MNRRHLLRAALAVLTAVPGLPGLASCARSPSRATSRARPGDPGWPSEAQWEELRRRLGGRLLTVRSPLDNCVAAAPGANCAQVFRDLKNPYYLGDEPGLTQTLGWVDAWTSRPSVYAVAAESAADVVAAVDFARAHNLRLVVKGGGHSYQGTSSSPDSLLVWTRRMNAITLHDAFVAAGCEERQAPQPAVSIGAGALWGQVYDAVTTKAGRYVQGGGCLTVGVAGLIQSGGFGSFSKRYGLAAASLLEAEVVTADGELRIANACTHPDLFWGLKGGGGGSLGVVTRVTLRTHDLPDVFGAVFASVRARSDAAFRRLVARVIAFYREALLNPHWGEQLALRPDNRLSISMLWQDLDQAQAEAAWRPFFDWVAAAPQDFALEGAPTFLAVPARRLWDPAFLEEIPGVAMSDDRPGAPPGNIFWAGNREEAGQVLHGYQSAWLPASLLHADREAELIDALFAASRHWGLGLHMNKGLAGAPAEAIAAARDTAMNPAVLDAFALVICGAEGPPAWPGIPGHEPDRVTARRQAAAIGKAMAELRRLVPRPGSYVSESDFFEESWQDAFWGVNYRRLLAVKQKYDPEGLFFVHHGVGAEDWSADGFTRLG
jgi:FAD/FMN-containing dehydrogenase